jgi:SAM-dependent methyltransferase
MNLDQNYWNERWEKGQTGWDIGAPSTPLKEYFDQIKNKDLHILIPGCGNAYEAEYLHQLGFHNVFLIDIAPLALASFRKRFPEFPKEHLINDDFFAHRGKYDLIVEQTFFCALNPNMREAYCAHMHNLLAPGGKLVGVLFDDMLNNDHPPFGGNKTEYQRLFEGRFLIKVLESAHNSIAPRAGREVFIIFEKSKDA